jgi:hypothetical protein
MSDNTLVILGACGVAMVLMAIGAVFFWWVTKSLNRFFIVGLVRRLIGGVDEYTDKNDETVGSGYVQQRARRDLRSQAQSLDFDSAVARHRGEPVSPTNPADASAQAFPNQNTAPTPNEPSLRSRTNRQRKRDDDSLDEVFGGMMDTDGDGDIDF